MTRAHYDVFREFLDHLDRSSRAAAKARKARRADAIKRDLRTPKYRPRVVADKRKQAAKRACRKKEAE